LFDKTLFRRLSKEIIEKSHLANNGQFAMIEKNLGEKISNG